MNGISLESPYWRPYSTHETRLCIVRVWVRKKTPLWNILLRARHILNICSIFFCTRASLKIFNFRRQSAVGNAINVDFRYQLSICEFIVLYVRKILSSKREDSIWQSQTEPKQSLLLLAVSGCLCIFIVFWTQLEKWNLRNLFHPSSELIQKRRISIKSINLKAQTSDVINITLF